MRRRGLLLAAAAAMAARQGVAQAAARPFTTTEVAPGIHVRHGVHEEATAANGDGIANIGFVVGDRSVLVIDPGGSQIDGEGLRARVHAITDRPISHVLMSHMHPDHVFGAGAFAAEKPVFVGHVRLGEMLVQRGEYYRGMLTDVLGLDESGDYAKPDLLVHDTVRLDLGNRPLLLTAHRTAHTDNDVSVLDERTGTLWAADLLFVRRVPALDGSITGWLRETRAIREGPAHRIVPGHGPVLVERSAAVAQERYLGLLADEIRPIIARGGGIEDAVATVGRGERDAWLLFDDYHGRNVTAAFKELEWE